MLCTAALEVETFEAALFEWRHRWYARELCRRTPATEWEFDPFEMAIRHENESKALWSALTRH